MPQPTNKLTQFWDELKRRKVVRVIAMYAATAFIIMEAGEIMLPRLGLPDWTVTFIIVLIIIGFPITVILSWIFDITPEGVKKTESAKVAKPEETPSEPQKRKPGAGDIIIALLVVVVVILAYPKIFKRDKFEDIKDEDGRISIAVIPFRNMTNDTLMNIWQEGIQNDLITKLSNSEKLAVRQYQTMYDFLQANKYINYASITPNIAKEISQKLNANTYILGNILSAGNTLRINAQLVNSETEEIYKTFQVDGKNEDEILIISDSLSNLIRNYLEIKALEKDLDPDFIASFSFTISSAEAYQYYIQGLNSFFNSDYSSVIQFLTKALEIDSGFTIASFLLSNTYYNNGQYKKANEIFKKVCKDIDNVPFNAQLWINWWKAHLDKKPRECIKYLKQLAELDSQSRIIWNNLGDIYKIIHNYEKEIDAYEKYFKIEKNWGIMSKWISPYIDLGQAYHEIGNHVREKEVYELGLSIIPDNPEIIYRQAICALSQEDTAKANEYIRKYRSIRETEGLEDYWTEYRIGEIYHEAKQFNNALNIFRDLIAKNPHEPSSKLALGYILINNDINVDEGLEFIEQALEIEPVDDESLHADLLYTKGMGLYKQGSLEEALEILNKSWDLLPLYSHDQYLLMKEVEQALASQNK